MLLFVAFCCGLLVWIVMFVVMVVYGVWMMLLLMIL